MKNWMLCWTQKKKNGKRKYIWYGFCRNSMKIPQAVPHSCWQFCYRSLNVVKQYTERTRPRMVMYALVSAAFDVRFTTWLWKDSLQNSTSTVAMTIARFYNRSSSSRKNASTKRIRLFTHTFRAPVGSQMAPQKFQKSASTPQDPKVFLSKTQNAAHAVTNEHV